MSRDASDAIEAIDRIENAFPGEFRPDLDPPNPDRPRFECCSGTGVSTTEGEIVCSSCKTPVSRDRAQVVLADQRGADRHE